MKIAFDIGGVLSRYPEQMKTIMIALIMGGIDVHIVTDIPAEKALPLCQINGLTSFISPDHIHSADWAAHGDMCKTILCESLGIDLLIDDRPDYVAVGNFIGLVVAPRPQMPYSAPEWVPNY